MKINVILISYNQEKYISKAIESILMQRFNGEIEIIVADDYSTDTTLSIIKSYEHKTNFKFIYLKTDKNLGHPQNYKRAFDACDGDYVAIMEGDDYWINPYRLQKHIDFLDSHRECPFSMNRLVIYEEDKDLYQVQDWDYNNDFYYITSQELAQGNKLGNLSACVFRLCEIKKLPDTIFELDVDDWLLGLALGQYGLLAKLKDATSVYRRHSKGLWAGKNNFEVTNSMVQRIDIYNKFFDYKYHKEFIAHKNRLMGINNKNISFKDFVPPILLIILKLIIPKVLVKIIIRWK